MRDGSVLARGSLPLSRLQGGREASLLLFRDSSVNPSEKRREKEEGRGKGGLYHNDTNIFLYFIQTHSDCSPPTHTRPPLRVPMPSGTSVIWLWEAARWCSPVIPAREGGREVRRLLDTSSSSRLGHKTGK